MTDRRQEISDQFKQMAQASADKNPESEDQLSQQIVKDTLTSKAPKPKKTKAIAPTDRTTRASSKTPMEATPTGSSTPREGPPASGALPDPMEGPLASGESTRPGDTTGTATVAERYKGLLGNSSNKRQADANLANPGEIELLSPSKRQDTGARSEDLLTEMVRQGLAAEEKGNKALALMYFNISSGLGKQGREPSGGAGEDLQTTQPSRTGPQPTEKATQNLLMAVPTPNPVEDPSWGLITPVGPADAMPGGIIFDDAARPASHDVGFTPFFERNLRELRSPLPLMIFNEVWQDKAIIHYAKKRSKADENNTDKYRYTGYSYLCEYTQTYAERSINHQGFHAALLRICNYPKFASWLLGHKRICDQLVTQYGFMTGLRYDINVRMNAFAHCVVIPGGQVSITNISVRNEEIAQKIIARTRKFDEIDFTENPYAKGGERKTWDPVTGRDPTKTDGQANTSGTAAKGNRGNHQPGRGQGNQNRGQSPDRGQGLGRQPRSQGYKGSQWDNGYNERENNWAHDCNNNWGNDRGKGRGHN
ncbi:hypothetical protein PTTG_25275 [Puccinia triticina 1-1 BBBD Race 1]|uniref:Uncharacterized protein n=1 Tax=Puccinia triticina (isolate 1-1 / race 1 (BBBD)) TaxID=630390 RepID=A0A180H404_PUCT1|nr:hypothetical protein PTTG_25275 [Puccinia triticina 1-1 BBBD Race 1]